MCARRAEEAAFRASIEKATHGTAFAVIASSLVDRLMRFQRGRVLVSEKRIGAFASELGAWLDEVEAEFAASNPETALEARASSHRRDLRGRGGSCASERKPLRYLDRR